MSPWSLVILLVLLGVAVLVALRWSAIRDMLEGGRLLILGLDARHVHPQQLPPRPLYSPNRASAQVALARVGLVRAAAGVRRLALA